MPMHGTGVLSPRYRVLVGRRRREGGERAEMVRWTAGGRVQRVQRGGERKSGCENGKERERE